MEYVSTIEPGLDIYFVDGRTKAIPTKEYLAYRESEILEDIRGLIKKAWERGQLVYHSNIDTIIRFQKESPEKARKYIGYQFLGTNTYLEVFGKEAEARYRWQQHEARAEEIKLQLDSLQEQMWDMQKLLLNMAKGEGHKRNKEAMQL